MVCIIELFICTWYSEIRSPNTTGKTLKISQETHVSDYDVLSFGRNVSLHPLSISTILLISHILIFFSSFYSASNDRYSDCIHRSCLTSGFGHMVSSIQFQISRIHSRFWLYQSGDHFTISKHIHAHMPKINPKQIQNKYTTKASNKIEMNQAQMLFVERIDSIEAYWRHLQDL